MTLNLHRALFSTLLSVAAGAALFMPAPALADTYSIGLDCDGEYCNGRVTNEDTGETSYTKPVRSARRALRLAAKLAKEQASDEDSFMLSDEEHCETLQDLCPNY